MKRSLLHIKVLGRFELALGERPYAFAAPPRTLPLLAYLLLKRATALPRERVAQTLWPDDPDNVARTNLRRHLHYLQRALPSAGQNAGWLLVTPKTVRWNVDAPYVLDSAEFERLAATAEREAAAALYAGDLLEEHDEEWLLYDRERLRNRQAALLTELIDFHRRRRQLDDALTWAQRLLALEAWREDAVRAVVSLRYERGDRAGALAEYERFARRLGEELGVAPMLETVALAEVVGAAGSVAVATPVTAPPVPPARFADDWSVLPFVGRESETERLLQAWERAGTGHGTTMLVGGEAGAGKTRLVTSFAAEVERRGGRVLRGITSFPEAAPFQAIASAIASAGAEVAALELERIWLEALGTIVPHVRQRAGDFTAPALLDPRSEQRRLFEAVARAFEALARAAPTVVVLEDMHWAGAGSIALLESLTRRCAAAKLLFVATYREEEVQRDHPFRPYSRRLMRESPGSHLALSPLDRPAVAALLDRFAHATAVPPAFVEQLHARSEGNPFFLGELLRDAVERGAVDARAGRWSFGAGPSVESTAGIDAVIVDRLRRLSAHAMLAAELGAVIGDAFDVEVLREAAGWSQSQALDALDELLDHHIVRDGGAAKVDFAFSHHLIAAAAYAHGSLAEMPRRHRRVARVLEELYPDSRDELARRLAHHYARCGDDETAAAYGARAATRALSLFAADEALVYAERALAATRKTQTRLAALLVCEEAYRRRGDRERQTLALAELAAIPPEGIAFPEHLEIERRRIALAHVRGDAPAELAAIAVLLEAAQGAGLPEWEGVAIRAEGARLVAAGELDAARRELRRALDVIGPHAQSGVRFEIYCGLANVAIHQADAEAAARWLERAEGVADLAGDDFLRYRVLSERYALARDRDDARAVYALARSVLESARLIGDAQAEMFAHLRLGNAALFAFDIGEAREHIDRSYEMSSLSASPKERFGIVTVKGMLALAVGDVASARTLFGEALALAIKQQDRYSRLVGEINVVCAACAAGDVEAALLGSEALADAARRINAPYLEAGALGARGAVLRRAGRAAEACCVLERCVALYRSLEMEAALGQDLAELAFAYLECGRPQAGRSIVEELVRAAGRADAGAANPHFMLWAAARLLRAAGDAARADAVADVAHERYLRMRATIPDAPSRECFASTWFAREIVADRTRRKRTAAVSARA